MKKALIIGGTGPTGIFIISGLLSRGFEVTILHRGTHESSEIPHQVRHIHADPHFKETLEAALIGTRFDLVIASYGRLKVIAEVLKNKTNRLITVGSIAGYYGLANPSSLFPYGLGIPCSEDGALVESEQGDRFSYLVAEAERSVMAAHASREYSATHFRYPYVYGPRQPIPREWSVVRRILEKRGKILLPDGGLTLMTQGYAENLAHAVLLAIDQPEISSGKSYNVGDEQTLTLRQWVEVISHQTNHQFEIISLPESILPADTLLQINKTTSHVLMDISKVKRELGYKDKVPVIKALEQTVQWLLENPPERGGNIEKLLADKFNYAKEDALIESFRNWNKQLADNQLLPSVDDFVPHAYAHPKAPGESTDHRGR